MKNKFGVYQKNTSVFFTTFLLIFIFSNAKSIDPSFFEIKNEIDSLRPKYEWQKVEITEFNAPVLSKFVNKYLQKFCAKTDQQIPPICLYYNSNNDENYNNYWDGKNILLGSEIVQILFYSQNFEKYFAALFAHEFAHFKLKHKPCANFNQEEEADKLAFTLIDNPEDLVLGHLFMTLSSIITQALPESNSDITVLTAQTIEIFNNIAPDFGKFTECSCWWSVYQLFYEAYIKTKFNTNLYIFSKDLAVNLGAVSSKSKIKRFMNWLIPRHRQANQALPEKPIKPDTHPSPKQLSNWAQNLSATQAT